MLNDQARVEWYCGISTPTLHEALSAHCHLDRAIQQTTLNFRNQYMYACEARYTYVCPR
jgi:hypothetical protein